MILIDPTNAAISTLYGEEGYRELRDFMKKLRLDRVGIRQEGDPVLEHLIIPQSKMDGGVVAQNARLSTRQETADAREAKATRCRQAIKDREARAATPRQPDHAPEDHRDYRRDASKRRRARG